MGKPQLFLLHFAGGNVFSFQYLLPYLQEWEVVPVELPGRGRRIGEGLLTDFDQAAMDIYRQVERKLRSSFFLVYGHSMGAYLALRVSNLLEAAGNRPAYLVVSGNAGPGCGGGKAVHMLDRGAFIDKLESLGGMPEGLIADSVLFDFFEPILRADFQIASEHTLDNEVPSGVPIHAMMGSLEEKVDRIENWGRFTRSAFSREVFEGGHFFIQKHPGAIAATFSDCYRKVVFHSGMNFPIS